MPTAYHLAIDIGASSGRHILGRLEDGRIILEEIHRFDNAATEKDGVLQWDTERLIDEIVAGLRKAGNAGKKPVSLGIDTWGVDYVLVDEAGERLGPAVAYRDGRVIGVDSLVYDIIGQEALYARTGIQAMVFNSIFQLYAQKLRDPGLLDRAAAFLMMPSYLNFRLTGNRVCEYTNATTTGLVDAATGDWDWALIEMLGLPAGIFGPPAMPGTTVGGLSREMRERVGYDVEVMLPGSHDTASAVLATPEPDCNAVYLSSGTWSLMGIERDTPDCREICRRNNFANEGGYNKRYRFLKNIMGLWIIQSLRKELAPGAGFGEISEMAEKGMNFGTVIDANHPSLLAPKSMAEAIRTCCRERSGAVPAGDHEILACAYNSLASSYAQTVDELERLSGRSLGRICVMGGGSQDSLLNRLTARYTGRNVTAGPVEATAIGNLLAQMLKAGSLSDVAEARRAVRSSFDIKKIEP